MKAVLWKGPGEADLAEVSVPRIRPGEILLRLRACGLCGTDLSKIFHYKGGATPILGHEVVGTVEAVGPGVERFRVGDRAVVAHHVPCGSCRACRHGNDSMCPQFKETNIDPGGFAEMIRIPAKNVEAAMFPVPGHLADEAGLFMEPLACALRAVKRALVLAGDRVAVVGVGSMGLLLLQGAAAAGARVIGVDPRADRRELATRLDAWATLDPADGDPVSKLMGLTGGEGLDAVFLTAVTRGTVAMGQGALRAGGRLLVFADVAGSTQPSLDFTDLFYRELSVVASYSSSPAEWGEALNLLASHRVRVGPLVTHRLPLARFAEGAHLQRQGEALKVVFHP